MPSALRPGRVKCRVDQAPPGRAWGQAGLGAERARAVSPASGLESARTCRARPLRPRSPQSDRAKLRTTGTSAADKGLHPRPSMIHACVCAPCLPPATGSVHARRTRSASSPHLLGCGDAWLNPRGPVLPEPDGLRVRFDRPLAHTPPPASPTPSSPSAPTGPRTACTCAPSRPGIRESARPGAATWRRGLPGDLAPLPGRGVGPADGAGRDLPRGRLPAHRRDPLRWHARRDQHERGRDLPAGRGDERGRGPAAHPLQVYPRRRGAEPVLSARSGHAAAYSSTRRVSSRRTAACTRMSVRSWSSTSTAAGCTVASLESTAGSAVASTRWSSGALPATFAPAARPSERRFSASGWSRRFVRRCRTAAWCSRSPTRCAGGLRGSGGCYRS